jgi:hypothetical protein
MTIAVILACEKLSLTEGYETHLCYLSQSKHYQENNYEELIKIPADTGLRYTCTYSLQKTPLIKMRVGTRKQFPHIPSTAVKMLLPVSSTYHCETNSSQDMKQQKLNTEMG